MQYMAPGKQRQRRQVKVKVHQYQSRVWPACSHSLAPSFSLSLSRFHCLNKYQGTSSKFGLCWLLFEVLPNEFEMCFVLWLCFSELAQSISSVCWVVVAAPTRFLQQQMNEKLLGLVVSSTVYWLLTQFPAGRSTALRRRRDFAIEVAALLPLPLSMRVQLNILPYLIENALELVLQLDSRRPQLLDCSTAVGARLDSSALDSTRAFLMST